MGRFRNVVTGAVVSVDDSKDDRFSTEEWEPVKAKSAKKTSKSDD